MIYKNQKINNGKYLIIKSNGEYKWYIKNLNIFPMCTDSFKNLFLVSKKII
jgi:hypothetical protein